MPNQKELEYRKTINKACIELGDLLREDLGETDESIKCYSIASEISKNLSDKADALHMLGLTYRLHKKEPEKAIKYYKDAISLRDSGWSWCDLGNCYLEKEKPEPDLALNCFEKASKIKEEDPSSWNISSAFHCMGHTYKNFKEDLDKAIECYENAIELCEDPNYWHYKWSWWDMSQCFLAKGEYGKAIESSDKAINVEPGNPIFWHTKAYSLLKLERFEIEVNPFW